MSVTIPKIGSRLRLFALAYGAAVLFWLSLEDHHMLPVVLLGTGAAVLVLRFWFSHRFGGQVWDVRRLRLLLPAAGALGGAGAVLMTVVLMFFKTSWHSHAHADYPLAMMLAMLQRIPAWSLAGALGGLALLCMGLLVASFDREMERSIS